MREIDNSFQMHPIWVNSIGKTTILLKVIGVIFRTFYSYLKWGRFINNIYSALN